MIGSCEFSASKILIVDDRKVNVLLLERVLCGAGYLSVTSTLDPGEVCDDGNTASGDGCSSTSRRQ